MLVIAAVGVQRITAGEGSSSPTSDDLWLIADQALTKPSLMHTGVDDSNGIYLGRIDQSGNLLTGTRIGSGGLAAWSESGNLQSGSFTFQDTDGRHLVAVAGEATSSILRIEEPKSSNPIVTTVATVPGTAQHVRPINAEAFGIRSAVPADDDAILFSCLRLGTDGTQSEVATGQDCQFAADGSVLVTDNDSDQEQTTFTRFAPDGTSTSVTMPGYWNQLDADSALVATTSDSNLWVADITRQEVLVDGDAADVRSSWMIDSDIDSAGNSRVMYAVDRGTEKLEIKVTSSDGSEVTVASGATANGLLLDDDRAWLATADTPDTASVLREYDLVGGGPPRDLYTATDKDVRLSFALVPSGGGLLVESQDESETVNVHSLSTDGAINPAGTTVATLPGRFLHAGNAMATALYEEGNGDTLGNAGLSWFNSESDIPTAINQANGVELLGVTEDGTAYFRGGLTTADEDYRHVLLSARPGEQPKIEYTIPEGYFNNAWPTPEGLVFTVSDYDSEEDRQTSQTSVLTTDETSGSSMRPFLMASAVVNAPVTGWLAQPVEDSSGFPVEAFIDDVAKQCDSDGTRREEAPFSASGRWPRFVTEVTVCATIPRTGVYDLGLDSSQVDYRAFSVDQEYDEPSTYAFEETATLDELSLDRGTYPVNVRRSDSESDSAARFTLRIARVD